LVHKKYCSLQILPARDPSENYSSDFVEEFSAIPASYLSTTIGSQRAIPSLTSERQTLPKVPSAPHPQHLDTYANRQRLGCIKHPPTTGDGMNGV
jgi:hypothetical protein